MCSKVGVKMYQPRREDTLHLVKYVGIAQAVGCTTLRSRAAGILGVIRSTCIVFLLPKSFQGICSRFQWWSRDMEVPPVWGVPTASEGHLGLVSFLHFGHCEIHTGFMAQVLSIRIHKYSRIYSNILSDRREIYCYRTCSLFSKRKHLTADLRDVTLSILVAWSHESSLS